MTKPLIWREIDSAPTDENLLLMCDDGTVALGKYGAEKGSFDRNGKPLIGVELWVYPPGRPPTVERVGENARSGLKSALAISAVCCVLAAALSQCDAPERKPGALTGGVVLR